jgi:hypothetical protein
MASTVALRGGPYLVVSHPSKCPCLYRILARAVILLKSSLVFAVPGTFWRCHSGQRFMRLNTLAGRSCLPGSPNAFINQKGLAKARPFWLS